VIQFVSLMAFGDALITLSLLQKCQARGGEFRIIGTGVTRQVASLFAEEFPLVEVLADKAAFNTIKERGGVAAVRDFIAAAAGLRRLTRRGDILAFERADIRNRLLIPPGRTGSYAPYTSQVYEDRRTQMAALFGESSPWPVVSAPASPVERVLINPCARYRRRRLQGQVMDNVVALSRQRGWELTLVDPCAEYAGYAGQVDRYLSRPALAEAAEALRDVDFYIGPDSFFVHLAYHYRIPHFGFFYPDHLDFQPPGMYAAGNWATFTEAADPQKLPALIARYLQT